MSVSNPRKAKRIRRRAAEANLVYVNCIEREAIVRKRCGRGFTYKSPAGRTITSQRIRKRIESLVIPPGWKNVLIAKSESGHLQAVGIDEAGRRQYIYHPHWHTISTATKFDRMQWFGERLPSIRRRVLHDLNESHLTRSRVLAAIVRLLDKGHLRIGNQRYVNQNGAHGATTLLNDHVELDRSRVTLMFPGKSGRQREVELSDKKVAKVIRQCEEIDGQFLFQYLDSDDQPNRVESSDVNTYLKDVGRDSITAKDFRTWWGCTIALSKFEDVDDGDSPTSRKKKVSSAISATANELGNTKAVCRSSYIHPGLISVAESGTLPEMLADLPTSARRGLTIAETRFLAILPLLNSK